MDSDLPTKKISELMRLASLGPDGQNIGVNDSLMLQLEVKSRQVWCSRVPAACVFIAHQDECVCLRVYSLPVYDFTRGRDSLGHHHSRCLTIEHIVFKYVSPLTS